MHFLNKKYVVATITLGLLLLVTPLAAQATDPGEADFAKGWDLLKQNKYAEARAALEAGTKKSPSNALARFYLADACRGLKDWTCAEEEYETSIELDPKSSAADLAKARLRKAKAWRLLGEAKQIIEGNDSSKASEADEKLKIAIKLGLDDEQQALHEILSNKNSKRVAEANKQEGLRGLVGLWKFVGGTGLFRATVNDQGELEMRVERLPDGGGRFPIGAKILFSLVPIEPEAVSLSFYDEPVRRTFRSDASFYARGYQFVAHTVPAKRIGERFCGGWSVRRPIRVLIAYVRPIDTIRLLPLDWFFPSADCEIPTVAMASYNNGYFDDMSWMDELIRVQ